MGMYYIITCCTCILLHINLVSSRTGNTNCKVFNTNLLRCHGEYPSKAFYLNDITELYLEKLTWENLNLNYIIEKFPNLNKLSVNESEITSITISNKSNNIKVLLLRTNKIKSLPSDFITYLPELEMLFLENNKLVEMPVNFHLGNLQKMYIRNNPWKCAKDLTWALQLNKSVVKDIVNATCKDKYAGKNLLLIAKYKEEMNSNCIKACECSLENVVQDAKTDKVHPIPIIMMNCSHQDFTEMPTQLPLHTRILHLEGNLISDIRVLKTNPVFKSLWDLYLDNNTITSISYLEGSHWLENFRVFSLRGNKLTKLPAFALDNALMKNPNMPGAVVLYLGGNPWRCDCIFVPVFQELVLQKYSTRIEDIKDVKCSYVEGDENSLLPIINLSRSSVCMVPSDFSLQEGLDLLNAILASLIVFVLGKLAYDYYHFKKSGRLPWIVTKMP